MIIFHEVHKQFGHKVLLDSVSETLESSARIGVIGVNGAGKSVLLKMIAGGEEPDRGGIVIPNDFRIAYLPQEIDVEASDSVMQYVLKPFRELLHTEHLYKELSLHHEDTKEYQKITAALDKVQKKQYIYDVFSIQARAKAFLAGLGVAEASWNESIDLLSGGFRMRVILVRLLLQQPDFLLLDEPTNHLDMDSLIWLESFLQRFDGGMAIVSHDRAFLDRVTDTTAELVNGKLCLRKESVSGYLAWKEEYNLQVKRQADSMSEKIARAERFVERFKAKATKATQAHSKQKQIDKLKSQMINPLVESNQQVRFTLKESARSSKVPLTFERVTLGYDLRDILKDVSVTVNRGDKIAVVGPNGAGKSTFLKACAGMLAPREGELQVGQNTSIRYFSQHRLDQLDVEATVYDSIARLAPQANRTQIQSILGAFLFSGEEVQKKVGVLSGGEKARLSLAAILADPGNVLLLDEPTNHLDIGSIERLADVLHDFGGTIIIVSHDECFINRVANRIIEIRPQAFRDFPGRLNEYRAYIEEGILRDLGEQPMLPAEGNGRSVNQNKEARMHSRKQRKQLERKIEKLEAAIASCEAEIQRLTSELHDPCHAQDFEKLQAINQTIADNETQHEQLMSEWEELHIRLEDVAD